MARFLVYGSSATYGLYGGKEGGWADRLKNTIIERDGTTIEPHGRVFNLAAGALCLPEIVQYLPMDIKRYRARCRMVGIFAVGNIESAIIGKDVTEPTVPLHQFQTSLEAVTEICDNNAIRQLFVGMSPIDDSISIHPTVKTDRERSELYERAIEAHTRDSGATHVSIQRYMRTHDISDQEFLSSDGQHPNEFGHSLIHQLVLNEIDEMLSK